MPSPILAWGACPSLMVAGRVDKYTTLAWAPIRPVELATIALVAASGPNSCACWTPSICASLARARFTRLLIVPTHIRRLLLFLRRRSLLSSHED